MTTPHDREKEPQMRRKTTVNAVQIRSGLPAADRKLAYARLRECGHAGVLNLKIWQEDELFICECIELGTASQGPTKDDAFVAMVEATELFLIEASLDEISERLKEHDAHENQEVGSFALSH